MNSNKGLNIHDLLINQCEGQYKEFQKKLVLNEEKRTHLDGLLTEFVSSPSRTTLEKGQKLEMLTKKLFEYIGFFDAFPNIHTSTNEIDFLCTISSTGRIAKSSGYISFDDEFLVECKNYASRVGVTYVGKFASLLRTHNKKFGIMVSPQGITGNGWNDAIGLIKKIYLKDEIMIVSFDLEDFHRLQEESFFSIIESKKDSIKNDTDIIQFITKHPAELVN